MTKNKIKSPPHRAYTFLINDDYIVEDNGELYYKLPVSFLTKGMISSIEDRVRADGVKRLGNTSVKIKGNNWSWQKYKDNKWRGENSPQAIDDVISYLLWDGEGVFVRNLREQTHITLKQFECLLKIHFSLKEKRKAYCYTYERDENLSDNECMDLGCYY